MSVAVKIFEQSFWQILGKVITSFSTIIILGMVARNYGEAGVGVFTLTLTYLAIFYLLADFGFNAHALKKFQISNFKFQIEEFKKLLGTRLLWSLFLVAVALGLLPFWPFTSSDFAKAVMFGSLAIVASAVFVTCNLIFQSKLRYDLSVLASSIGTVFGLGVFIWFVFLNFPIPYLLFAHLASWIIIALMAQFLLYRLVKTTFPVYDIQYTKYLFKSSWPIAATLALNVIYFRADAFMIAIFKSINDVGIYNAAYSIFQSALVLPAFIMNAYYPMMLRSLNGIKLVGLVLVGLAGLGTVVVMIFAPLIMRLLTGGGFSGSVISLQILSLGFPAYFLSALLMWLFVTKGRYKIMLLIYALGLMVNLLLNFVYIPQYSFLAASWVTVFSEYVILLMQVVLLFLKL